MSPFAARVPCGGPPNAQEETGVSRAWSIPSAELMWSCSLSELSARLSGGHVLMGCVSCPQVSHHPPAAAHHVYSRRGWTLWQEITIASKFRGKYLSIMPLGR